MSEELYLLLGKIAVLAAVLVSLAVGNLNSEYGEWDIRRGDPMWSPCTLCGRPVPYVVVQCRRTVDRAGTQACPCEIGN